MGKKAYIKNINPNSPDSHQVSPSVMLTFIRWSNRSTYNYTAPRNEVREPLVVINDAVNVTVSNSKSSITPSLSAVLLAGDVNYSTAIHPGDFVFVNMVNWEDSIAIIDDNGKDIKGNSLRNRALSEKPINRINDGFKGLFKVQSVRRNLRVDPNSGAKTYFFELQAFGFTEFNTVMYYDPLIFKQLEGNIRLFQQQFDSFFGDTKSKKNIFSIQDTIPILISCLLGQGRRKNNNKIPNDTITHFEVPGSVGNLLGVKANNAIDIYNIIIGIWGSGGSFANLASGMNPNIKRDKELPSNFYSTGSTLQGRKLIDAEYWNNVKIWDILSKYQNSLINEMYTTYRVSPEGSVMPTLILRQKPFTSEHFESIKKIKQNKTPATMFKQVKVSRYLNIPRWKINSNLIYSLNLGMDEAARINFVQVYTRTVSANDGRNRSLQAGTKNYMFDIDDITRSGLKPFLASANFDFPEEDAEKTTKGKEWAELVSDWLFDGQLKESGTLQCQGIQEPISVGDNLEFDSIVYHIESITHNVSVDANGRKSFKTNLTLSFGVSVDSDDKRPVYSEMEHTDSFTNRKEDWAKYGERILPGFSDTQDIGGRIMGEETRETRQKSFTLSPNTNKSESGSLKDGTNDEENMSKEENSSDTLDNLLKPK